ncbi:MAG: hypothetical protein EOM92_15105 [Gammaproteobacteria bacterium]|nr:hypothetical protein [Gammaproteobacteria bacterium]
MAASFGPETQVVWYAPRAHAKPGPRRDRGYLLWPAWAHRVMAPEVRDRPLNPLALAVLRLLAASRATAREVAIHLAIHPELAAFVVADLQGSGYLDPNAGLTGRGRALLDDERDAALSLVPGWVFRDPWGEGLWPFVARELSPAQTSINDRGYPDLELGTTGKPWTQRAFMQRPPEGAAARAPEAREILRAADQHRRIARRLGRYARSHFWEEDGPDLFDPKRLDLARIAEIEAEAHPVYLATFLYVPQDGPDQELDWHVCDFFGRDNSLDLRRRIVEVADGQPLLARELDRVIGKTVVAKDFADYRQRQRQRLAEAQLLLDRALTLDIRRHPIQGALARMLDAWLELRELDAFADGRRCDSVLSECRKVMEGLFAGLRNDWPLTGLWRRIPKDRALRDAEYCAATKEVGFARLPDLWRKVWPDQLSRVTDSANTWNLRPLLMATLLGAQNEPEHPLRRAAIRRSDLLDLIESVVNLGGGASHYRAGQHDGEAEVRSAVDKTLVIVGSLLGLPVCSISEIEAP